MNRFFTKLFYGTFFSDLMFPKNISMLTLVPDEYILSEKNDIGSIIYALKNFDDIAAKDHISFRALHNLSWLCDLSASPKITEEQEIFLSQFLENHLQQYFKYDEKLWDVNLLSERLLFCIFALSPLMSKLQSESTKLSLQTIILRHAIFLRRNLSKHKNKAEYGIYLIRSIFASLALSEERQYLQNTLSKLYDYLENHFALDGGHSTRNASFQFQFLIELISLRDFLVKAGVSVSTRMQSVVAKSCDYLEFLCHPDGKFAIFNGSYENNKSVIKKIFNASPGKVKIASNCLRNAQYYRLISNDTFIIADFDIKNTASSHLKTNSSFPFELSVGEQRVFVNCGSGEDLGSEWTEAFQRSEAFNSITIEGASLSPTAKEANIPGKKGKKIISAMTNQGMVLEGARHHHCNIAKEKPFDLSHYRRLLLHKGGGVVQGEDWIHTDVQNIKKTGTLPVTCRFHLSPDVSAHISKTGSVIIDLGDNGQRVFNTGSGKISLEESIYVGAGYPQRTKQIVIHAALTTSLLKVRWAMQTVSKKTEKKEKTSIALEES